MRYILPLSLGMLSPLAQAALVQYDFTYDYIYERRADLGAYRKVVHSIAVDTERGMLTSFSSDILNGTLFDLGAPQSLPIILTQIDDGNAITVSTGEFRLPDLYWGGKYGDEALPTFSFTWTVPHAFAVDPLAYLDMGGNELRFLYGNLRTPFFGELQDVTKVVMGLDQSSVPEPSSLLLLTAGLSFLGWKQRAV